MVDAAIIAIGDELLIGQVVNTNATWLGEQLFRLGIPLRRVVTIGDDEAEILRAFDELMGHHAVVIVTGGLGPTHDDITKEAACIFFNTDLVENPAVLREIEQRWRNRSIALNQSTRTQAMVPRSCTILHNALGTAPGMQFTKGDSDMFILPGVPSEMKKIFSDEIIPLILKHRSGNVVHWRTLNTTGITESSLFELLGSIDDLLRSQARLAFLPSARGVRLRITVESSSAGDAESIISDVEERIRGKAERFIFSRDDMPLEGIIGQLLRARRWTLAVAESCTGGLISNLLTNIPGSSEYFLRGYVTYTNEAKTQLLDVPVEVIANHGAVSEEVAMEMARGARLHARADVAIATTGIAGPDGSSVEKPIGLVWIGFSDAEHTTAKRYIFGSDRITNKERFATAALDLLQVPVDRNSIGIILFKKLMKIRCFTAILFPATLCTVITEYVHLLSLQLPRSIADIAWVKKENIHVTLNFFGEIEESLLRHIIFESQRRSVRVDSPLQISLGGLGFFPNDTNPTVLWLGCKEHSNRLFHIQSSLQKIACELGNGAIKIDARKYYPHFTLGKIRFIRDMDAFNLNFHHFVETSPFALNVSCPTLSFIRSTLSSHNVRYEVISEFQFH